MTEFEKYTLDPKKHVGWSVESNKGLSFLKERGCYILRVFLDYESGSFRWKVEPKEGLQSSREEHQYVVKSRMLIKDHEKAIEGCESFVYWLEELMTW